MHQCKHFFCSIILVQAVEIIVDEGGDLPQNFDAIPPPDYGRVSVSGTAIYSDGLDDAVTDIQSSRAKSKAIETSLNGSVTQLCVAHF